MRIYFFFDNVHKKNLFNSLGKRLIISVIKIKNKYHKTYQSKN